MPRAVSHSVDDFLRSVAEAVAIVLAVSLVSLGMRTGMVVVISIPVVLAVTALFMDMFGIGLHKVSLGTLVLALGLLVDDAIIAVEMMAVKLEQGWSRSRAAAFAYTSTAFPMLTGTLVTVAGFLPIALAKSSTGEYTRSIFEVSAIALITSWFAAVVLIPLLGYHMLPERKREAHLPDDHEHDIYDTRFYQHFRRWVGWCVDRRYLVLGGTVIVFIVSMTGFSLIPKQFFPSSDRPELLVDVRLQEGASFAATLRQVERLEKPWTAGPRSSTWSASWAAARALLPAAGPAAGHAQLRPVRHHRPFGGGPREAGAMAERQATRGIQRRAHAPVTPGERTAGRLPGAVPHQRRQDRHRARHRREGRRPDPRRRPHRQRAVRLGRAVRALGALRDRPAEGARSRRHVQRRVQLPGPDAVRLHRDAVPRARQADQRGTARAARGTRRPGPPGHAGHAHAQRPRAAGQPGAAALRPGIRGDLGARPPAHHHGAGRRGRRRPGHRRDPRPRQAAGRAAPGAACRLSHPGRRHRRGKRQGPELDQRPDADHAGGGADAADGAAAELRAS